MLWHKGDSAMTFEEFREDFHKFLQTATVNLGRKTAKTRVEFIIKAMDKIEKYGNTIVDDTIEKSTQKKRKKQKKVEAMDDRVKCMKPKDSRRALNIGKGVTSMTASESARADEQLNRSPFAGKNKKGNEDD